MPRKAAVGNVIRPGIAAEVAEGFVADDVLSIGSAAVEVDKDAVALGKGAVAAEMVGEDVAEGFAGLGALIIELYVADGDGTAEWRGRS